MTELGFKPSSDKVGDQCSKIPNLDCFSWQWQRRQKQETEVAGAETCLRSYSLSISVCSPSTGQGHLTSLSPFPAGVLPQAPFPLWGSRPLVIAAVSCDSQGQYHRTGGTSCINKANADQTGLLAANAEISHQSTWYLLNAQQPTQSPHISLESQSFPSTFCFKASVDSPLCQRLLTWGLQQPTLNQHGGGWWRNHHPLQIWWLGNSFTLDTFHVNESATYSFAFNSLLFCP